MGDGATRYGGGHRLNAAGSPSANTGIAAVKANCHPNQFQKFFAANQYGFNHIAANGEIIGRSEKYTTAANRDHGLNVVLTEAPKAPVADLTPAAR